MPLIVSRESHGIPAAAFLCRRALSPKHLTTSDHTPPLRPAGDGPSTTVCRRASTVAAAATASAAAATTAAATTAATTATTSFSCTRYTTARSG